MLVVVAVLAGLLVSGVLAAALAFNTLVTTFASNATVLPDSQVFPSGARPDPASNGAKNILLVGVDGPAASADTVTPGATGMRSDTIMLVHLPADRSSVQIISIMRDSWVPIPGHGTDKINAAFSWGGAPLLVQTVEQLTGARIDHVAIVGFDGFRDMVDALGGVSVTVPQGFATDHYTFAPGPRRLDGREALEFVRTRVGLPGGDYQRVRNQQALIGGIVQALIARSTLTSPEKIFTFTGAVTKHLTIDQGLTFQTIFEIGMNYGRIRSSDVRFVTLATSGSGMEGDQAVVYLDQKQLGELRSALRSDTVDAFARSAQG
ncbi:transcriptional regulator [Leifsonia sp. LS1]|uniref:LCP family protein n=1 Tax=Leifsonia sp. LS1 TaxID=2828483 RepID=UPI001CFE4064|nr:LCP family protein [Leifsonia sp. LS1]GIT80779.1 transcriptional regulator [Leifsonia sp. LS1]